MSCFASRTRFSGTTGAEGSDKKANRWAANKKSTKRADGPEARGTGATKDRQEVVGLGEVMRRKSSRSRHERGSGGRRKKDWTPEVIEDVISGVESQGLKYRFDRQAMDTSAFFSVEPMQVSS